MTVLRFRRSLTAHCWRVYAGEPDALDRFNGNPGKYLGIAELFPLSGHWRGRNAAIGGGFLGPLRTTRRLAARDLLAHYTAKVGAL